MTIGQCISNIMDYDTLPLLESGVGDTEEYLNICVLIKYLNIQIFIVILTMYINLN